MSDQTFGIQEFEQVYKKHFEFLCNFANQYIHDSAISEDICQKVFITLWEKRREIDPSKSIKSFLFTSVKNRCLNYIRDNKKYKSSLLDIDCGDLQIGFTEHTSLELDDLQKKIDKALAELPDKCREVFKLSRFEEKKYKEIALELDVTQKTVEAHMSKALKHLRIALKDYFVVILYFLINY